MKVNHTYPGLPNKVTRSAEFSFLKKYALVKGVVCFRSDC